jgi:predicted acylesterase/phospholipase RssA
VALESGELRYVTETGHLHDRADQRLELDPVSLVDGILASASIPVAFPPVLLGDEHYVDGGAREILPLELLVEHLEVERVFAVSASTATIKPGRVVRRPRHARHPATGQRRDRHQRDAAQGAGPPGVGPTSRWWCPTSTCTMP